MEIKAKCTDRNLLLQFSGEMDHHAARETIRELELAIDAALPRKLVLDMEGVTFMDSSGIAVILRAKRSMEALGGNLVVIHIPRQAAKVLEAAGLGRYVKLI